MLHFIWISMVILFTSVSSWISVSPKRWHSLTSVEAHTQRPLGGYERLLSRTLQNSARVSLSHGSAFVLKHSIDHRTLVDSVAICMESHPLLKSFIGESGGLKSFVLCDGDVLSLARVVVRTVEVEAEIFPLKWKDYLADSLNGPEFPLNGPLWKLVNLVSSSKDSSAWIFTFNHGIDDQQSLMILVKDLISAINNQRSAIPNHQFPPSMETAVAPSPPGFQTLLWSLFQLYNAVSSAAVLPFHVERTLSRAKVNGDADTASLYCDPSKRSTFCEYFDLEPSELTRMRKTCKNRGVTVTNALAAAVMTLTSAAMQSYFIDSPPSAPPRLFHGPADIKLRFLLSVSLRPFGKESQHGTSSRNDADSRGGGVSTIGSDDWTGGTVACAAGAVDYVIKVPEAVLPTAILESSRSSKGDGEIGRLSSQQRAAFWELAQSSQNNAQSIINKFNFVPESVRLFALGMKYVDMLPIVEQEAANPASLGRGFSCGVSNVGVVDIATHALDDLAHDSKQTIQVREVYYGNSHARNGVLCLLSCATINGRFCACLQFTDPLVTRAEAQRFRYALKSLLLDL